MYKLTQEGRLQAYLLGPTRVRRFRKRDLDLVLKPMVRRIRPAPAAFSDAVLQELWDNPKDAAYDAL